ncbi:MAG: hypothetical protein M3186_13670 [Actinomycetota bacterium]|nr:hypothetical protein [Actinomycetota bacterium]
MTECGLEVGLGDRTEASFQEIADLGDDEKGTRRGPGAVLSTSRFRSMKNVGPLA